jgi:hypothetical protein
MSDDIQTHKQGQLWANYCWSKSHNLHEYVVSKMLEITSQQKLWDFATDIICHQFQSVYMLTRIIDKISSCEPCQYEYFAFHWHEANDQFIAMADMFLDTDC